MRKFAICCLTLMVVVSIAIVLSAYYSHVAGKSLEATDDIVTDMAMKSSHAKEHSYLPSIPEDMEPIGFTLAGMVGGFLVGFFWEDMMGREEDARMAER